MLSQKNGWYAMLVALPLASAPAIAQGNELTNLTGLPIYPSLSRAAMDPLTRTNALGRWCSRFTAETSYPLEAVEVWYRRALTGASETDLARDTDYRKYATTLAGIKLAIGIDYVTIFTVAKQERTSIELFRCSAPTRPIGKG